MIQDEDLDLLLSELSQRYGYDFTNYARASLKRRVDRLLTVTVSPVLPSCCTG